MIKFSVFISTPFKMDHVLRCPPINPRYFDSDIYRKTFKIIAPQCSRKDVYLALATLLKTEDIVSIEKADGPAYNVVVATDMAKDILIASDTIQIKETHRLVFMLPGNGFQ